MLRPGFWPGLAVVGLVAVLFAAASIIPMPKAFALFDTGHAITITDCSTGGDGACGSHDGGQLCNLHGGCISIGVLPVNSAMATAPGQNWAVGARMIMAGRSDFPAKPPPITFQ